MISAHSVAGRLMHWLRTRWFVAAPALLSVAVLFAYAIPGSLSQSSAARANQQPRWQPIGLQRVLVHALALGHQHAELALAAAHGGVYRRDRVGVWTRVLASGEVWSVELLPDDRTVLAGDNDGRIELSHDAGNHWRPIAVATEGVYALSAVPGHPRQLLAGTGRGIFLSRDGGLHWERHLELPHSAAAALAWQPGNGRVVFAGAVAGDASGSVDAYISRDAGRTWRVFGHRLQSTGGIMSLLATTDAHVYAGTMGNATWKASLQGQIWRKMARGMPLTGDHVAGLTAVPGHPETLYVGTLGFGVYRSVDGGRRWTHVSDGLREARDARIVLSMVYSRTRHALLAGTADGVYELRPA